MTRLGGKRIWLSFLFVQLALSGVVFGEPVQVGVLLPLSGPFARYGQQIQGGLSGVISSQIKFVFEDEGCDPRKAIDAYKKLSEIDNIKIFFGPFCGSPQTVVAPLLRAKGQLAVLGNSAPEAVYELSGGRMFSSQHSIESESSFNAEKLNEAGVASVVIVFKENQFSRAHEAAFRAHFKGKILDTLAYTSDDISELKIVATRIRQMKPEALYVPDAFPLMGGLMKELDGAGLRDLKVFSVYSAQSNDVLQVVGAAGKRVIYSYPAIGKEEALTRFPQLAAQILSDAIGLCHEDVSCLIKMLREKNQFDEHGVLKGALELKTFQAGGFVSVSGLTSQIQ